MRLSTAIGAYMKTSSIYTYVLTLIALIASAPAISHADFKLATVDINRVINEAPEAKASRKELDTLTQDAKKKVDAKRAVLKSVEDKIKAGQIKEDSKEADAFKNDAREFSRFVKDTEDDIRQRFMKTNKTLTDKALKIIKTYASSHNLDLVMDRSEGMRGPILFGNPSTDITDDIIKAMNG
jgi:outer membrane protein